MPFLNSANYEATGETTDDGRPTYQLLERLVYRWVNGGDVVVTVPVGFTSDLATIPKALTWLYRPGDARWDDAAIIHDFACTMARAPKPRITLTMLQADDLFYDAMLDLGTPKFIALIFYRFVRTKHILRGEG